MVLLFLASTVESRLKTEVQFFLQLELRSGWSESRIRAERYLLHIYVLGNEAFQNILILVKECEGTFNIYLTRLGLKNILWKKAKALQEMGQD